MSEVRLVVDDASPDGELAQWRARVASVSAADGDAALLLLAREASSVPMKLVALEAITGEQAAREAMHEYRDHDKRLYRAAKARWDDASGRRIADDDARALIAAARALLEHEPLAVNRVVELDHGWAAVNQALLDAQLRSEYLALADTLAARVREQGEHTQALMRQYAAMDEAREKLAALLPGIAQGEIPPDGSQALAVHVLELTQSLPAPEGARAAARVDAARRVLALAASVVERAKFLQALPAPGTFDAEGEKRLIEQWRAFPEISEGELHTALAQRFADWRNAGAQERSREHEAMSSEAREQHARRVAAIKAEIEAGEAAQAAGHIADLARHIHAIDQALKHGAVNASLTQRIDTLRREHKRLHDWQRWSGAQGREQLVTEAQALAAAVKDGGKVSVKTHADAIAKLRERWKEIDKLGGASSQSLWLAFDGALEAAYVPVAAHLEKLKAARDENLAAREKIVAGLVAVAAPLKVVREAVVRGAGGQDAAQDATAQDAVQAETPPVAPTSPMPKPDWRALAHALELAQVAWRKLGPVEHTVPRKALKGATAITTRYAAAVQAITAPLQAVYADARARREKLIANAKELAANAAARDVIDKVKKLQGEWQSTAKTMPLPRRDENALWTGFKAATDAIFTARDAARNAAEAEFNDKLKARDAVIESLAPLRYANAAPDIRRALAEADTAWRAAPEVPRSHAAKLDARYRAAREAASKRITELAAQASQARYDALLAKMALCEEREQLFDAANGNDTPDEAQATDLEARWNAVEQLPETWKARLDARFAGVAATTKAGKPEESLPDLLLNLESACGIDSPEEFNAARQQMKMRALKAAMESRQPAAPVSAADIERWLVDAAAHARPDAPSRERLAKIIAAVRRRGKA